MSGARAAGGLGLGDDARDRAEALGRRIDEHRARYYAGAPTISDDAFDALEDELRTIDPTHPALARVGAPPEPASEWEKARHEIPMGSLNKATSEDELRAWLARCNELGQKEGLGPFDGDLFVAEKLDGISLEVVYENGRFADAITRGDGDFGERISANVRRMKGVPRRIRETRHLSVRGEIILRLSDMRAHFPDLTSPRNGAAGLAKRLDGKGVEHLTVLFYDVAEHLDQKTQADRFAWLRSLGFATPRTSAGDLEHVLAVHRDYAATTRSSLDYEIDGLVVYLADLHAQTMLGEVNHRPRGAVAFKFASPSKISRIHRIHWETGPSGRVTPVAYFDPVELAGAMVKQASLHNASNVRELGVGVGDDVLVSRRNDVIPYVEEVLERHGAREEPPATCRRCGEPVETVGEYLYCRNKHCRAIVEGRIQQWIGAIGALEWGDKLIAQLVEAKLVEEPRQLYELTVEQIAGLERRGEKSAAKCLAELRARLPLPLPVFLAALGMEGFALETARLLVASGYDSLDKLFAATEGDLAAIKGLGPLKAQAILRGLAARKDEVERLVAAGIVPVAPSQQGALAGKTFAFTGTLGRPRAELTALVEGAGGRVLSTVTKDLHYLVVADPSSGSSKAEKARKYGTRVLAEADLEALLAGTLAD